MSVIEAHISTKDRQLDLWDSALDRSKPSFTGYLSEWFGVSILYTKHT